MRPIPYIKLSIDWRQAMLYEAALISLGLFIGSSWPELFTGAIKWFLLLVFVTAGGYISLLWLVQNKDDPPKKTKDR